MAKVKCIQISADIAEGAARRFIGIEASIRNAASALEGATEGASAIDSLHWIADEVSRLSGDLDVCTWDRARARTTATEEVSNG